MAELKKFKVAREHQGDKITDDGSVVHRFAEGDTRLADPVIVKTLVDSGVLIDPDAPKAGELRSDGPTIAEFVGAGYLAKNYPPKGYASRSTKKEIAAAIAEQDLAAKGAGGAQTGKSEGDSTETKVEPGVETKAEPASPPPPPPPARRSRAANKASPAAQTKAE